MSSPTVLSQCTVSNTMGERGMSNRGLKSARHGPLGNRLLAALPADDYERLRPNLNPVPLSLGEALYESGSPLRHVYFPVSGLVSLLYTTEDGHTAEIAVVGNDGCVGVMLLLGEGATTPTRGVVQIAGHAYRIESDALRTEFRSRDPTRDLLLRYVQALIAQISQTAVCNRHHSIEQQLCRWLLMSLDRLPGNEVRMTQELIGNMLGVRRAGITAAAKRLHELGLIEYRRGNITVPDRAKLQAHACECYAVVKKEMDRLLPFG